MKWRYVQALILGCCALAMVTGVGGRYKDNTGAVETFHELTPKTEDYGVATREAHDVPAVTSSGAASALSEQVAAWQEQMEAERQAARRAEEEAKREAEAQAKAAEPQLAVGLASGYVNVREKPDTQAQIVGKLYQNGVGEVLAEDSGWYLIESGSVTGYVNGEYVLTGEEGAALAEQVSKRLARVQADALRVRMEPSTEAGILDIVPGGETLAVTGEQEGWAKVRLGAGEGYVSLDYVEVYTAYETAESVSEEEERLAREEQARREAAAAAGNRGAVSKSNESASSGGSTAAASGNVSSASSSFGSSAPLGRQIADFALQFVGNPYVYGGTSLTDGADCSGFVQSVYKNFGISLPRTSGEQGACGTAVGGIDAAQPGDLIYYSGHIGIYIGNRQIVHASTSKSGIKVSNADFKPILSVRRIV